MRTAKEVLVAARELISDESRWTKGCEARNAQGHSVFPKVFSYTPEDRLPVCWCAGGALSSSLPRQPVCIPASSLHDGHSTWPRVGLTRVGTLP